jgi:hypothetical protein
MHKKYGLSSVDQAQNSDKTRRKLKHIGKVFWKSCSHEINVEWLLEGLEMIKHIFLVFCKASKHPSQLWSQFGRSRNVCQFCCLHTCSMESERRFCYCGNKERYWTIMKNCLQDHSLWESQHLIALWGWRNLTWQSLRMVCKRMKYCYKIGLWWERTCTSW